MNELKPDSEDSSLQKKRPRNQDRLAIIIVLGIAGILAILCGLAVFGILYQFGHSYFEPKVQVILEPDASLVSTVDSAKLAATAQILNARCNTLKCGFSYEVTNNQIIAKVPTSTDIETYVRKMIAIGLLEFVDFGDTPVPPGTRIRTDFGSQYFPQTEETIWHTVMTNDGFKEASLTTDSVGQIAISFTLTPKGTEIFSNYTTNNVGRYLGIVLDKTVISAPVVNTPIHDGQGVIQGHFTKEEAQLLASYLKIGEPLPIPLVIKDIQTNTTQVP